MTIKDRYKFECEVFKLAFTYFDHHLPYKYKGQWCKSIGICQPLYYAFGEILRQHKLSLELKTELKQKCILRMRYHARQNGGDTSSMFWWPPKAQNDKRLQTLQDCIIEAELDYVTEMDKELSN